MPADDATGHRVEVRQRAALWPSRWPPALWMGIGLALLLVALLAAGWMYQLQWVFRPQDTSAEEWTTIADRVLLVLSWTVAICALAGAAFVVAGLREGIAESWGWVVTGLVLAVTAASICMGVGSESMRLLHGWATYPM